MAVTSESENNFALVYAEFPWNKFGFGITRFMEIVRYLV
jgi:hypothetical protein